jgi:hypothetical protein
MKFKDNLLIILKDMKKLLVIFLIAGTLLALDNQSMRAGGAKKIKLELKDGWYFIDGQKFFVNALGYEIGARPGQDPKLKRKPELQRMKSDLAIIKDAGFNTIRTWDVLYKDELEVVERSGLKVIFGIEVNSQGDFNDPKFIQQAIHQVDTALSYSKNFDCIITYLIMNEPMPQHIKDVGSQATVDLWKKLTDLIHEKHPGIPVTISGNAAITEWFDMNIFDVYAFNCYDYGNGTNYALPGKNAFEFLKDINKQNKPLVITEFGLSVSRTGSGKYGTNTLEGQKTGLVQSYRDLLDAGVAGCCPFYYADGWWKGGEPSKHNDAVEEWFGFWGYASLLDTVGHPRPVWYALKTYNEALIASPKNQTFYQNKVPMEIFPQQNVTKLKVIFHDKVIYEKKLLKNGYFTDTISFAGETLMDRELVFEFYDVNDNLVKYETISILTGKDKIHWPELDINTQMKDLNENKNITVELKLKNDSTFTLGKELNYVFQHHIGWEPGDGISLKIDPKSKEQNFNVSYEIQDKTIILGIYAGIEIRYGKFVKTIYNEKYLYRGNWADAIRLK